jgi:tetratricopeptide (TPR) repeat protein
MGEAFAALTDSSSSIFWNPAGLSRMPFPGFEYMYNSWFVDIKHQYFTFAYPTANGTFGGSYSLLDSGDIQGYGPTGSTEALFKAQDTALTFSWGRRMNDRVSVGANLKMISEMLETHTANSTAFDVGAQLEVNPWVSLGAAIQNIGQPLKFISEDTPLPLTYRLGAAARRRMFVVDYLNLAADYVSSAGGNPSINVGAEYIFRDLLAIRLGASKGQLRAGVGIKSANYGLDYAYLSNSDLGAAHQVSMCYSFGSVDKKKALILEYITLGKAYYDKGKFADAVIEFRNVLALDPEQAEARALVTKATRALEGRAVEEVVGEIKAEKEAEVNTYLDAGKKFMEEKQYLEAITEFNKALKIIPSHPEAVKLMREAQSALEAEVSEKVKDEAKEHLGLALKHIATDNYTEALKEVEEVLKIDPGNVQALKLYRKLRTILKIEEK